MSSLATLQNAELHGVWLQALPSVLRANTQVRPYTVSGFCDSYIYSVFCGPNLWCIGIHPLVLIFAILCFFDAFHLLPST